MSQDAEKPPRSSVLRSGTVWVAIIAAGCGASAGLLVAAYDYHGLYEAVMDFVVSFVCWSGLVFVVLFSLLFLWSKIRP